MKTRGLAARTLLPGEARRQSRQYECNGPRRDRRFPREILILQSKNPQPERANGRALERPNDSSDSTRPVMKSRRALRQALIATY